MKHRHLSLQERHYIEIELKNGTSQNAIAKALGRPQGTISKEISRNRGLKGYRHKQAQRFTNERHKDKKKNIKMTDRVKEFMRVQLESYQTSPEQIAGWLKNKHNISIHHETIYRYILQDKKENGELYKHLRHQSKPYRKRYGSTTNSSRGIPDRVDIDQRPEEANKRERLGDWEADTVIGKNHKGAIVTLDERKSKLRLALPLKGKFADDTKDAIIELLKPLKDVVKTITFDNGKEFTKHKNIADALECDTYFAKPYHSWERGQNENANGLLRQYFPKGMELIDITKNAVIDAIDRLNNRPRKCLDFKTPYEAFMELSGFDARILIRGIPL
jgi:IS30 family transposase